MALPSGLIPVLAFVLTVGISVPVTLAAHLYFHERAQPFHIGLRRAVFGTGFLYLIGVGVVWVIAGDGLSLEFWELPATLVLTGGISLIILTALPLVIGQRLLRNTNHLDSDTALRYTTYGWPVAMIVVFGIFIAPGGHLLNLEGPQRCLAGFCGISTWLVWALLFEILVALLGPGLVGMLISTYQRNSRTARSR